MDRFNIGKSGKSISLVSLEDNILKISNIPGKIFSFKTDSLTIPVQDIIKFHVQKPTRDQISGSVHYERMSEAGDGGHGSRWSSKAARVEGRMTIHYIERSKKNLNQLLCRRLLLRHSDSEVIAKLSTELELALAPLLNSRPKSLLVIINPYGGRRKSKQIYAKHVAPMLDLAGISTEVILTERANHGFDLLQAYDLDSIDGIVSVGGDGMFGEIFNSILRRQAREAGIDVNDASATLSSPNVRVGVIPGGSTDSVALGIHGTTDCVTATLHVIFGNTRLLDVASIYTDNVLNRFSMTMTSYGYFGDLIKRSEQYRWLGPRRYDFAGLSTLLRNKAYKGTITYVEDPAKTETVTTGEKCFLNCDVCDAAPDDQENKSDLTCHVVTGKFLGVTTAHMTCRSHHTVDGVSPSAHLGDGHTDLILVKQTGRINYLRYLLRTAYHHSSPFNLPFVEVHKVKEMKFRHSDNESEESLTLSRSAREDHSLWNVDGEILDTVDIDVKVHCQLVPVFGLGPSPPLKPGQMTSALPINESTPLNKCITVSTVMDEGDQDVISLHDDQD